MKSVQVSQLSNLILEGQTTRKSFRVHLYLNKQMTKFNLFSMSFIIQGVKEEKECILLKNYFRTQQKGAFLKLSHFFKKRNNGR